jgi:hypothetical protein
MLRRCFVAAIGLFASVNLACAQSTPNQTPTAALLETLTPPESMEKPRIGDHWNYEVRDQMTGELKQTYIATVTDVSPAVLGATISYVGNFQNKYMTYDRSWNFLDNGDRRYTPNDGTGIQGPLAVGKTWSIEGTETNNATGETRKRLGSAKVTAKESITTRAGTFEAFKIESSIEARYVNDPNMVDQDERQDWYVPAIDHWVKRIYLVRSGGRVSRNVSAELIGYGRGP